MVAENFTFVHFLGTISAGFPSPAEGYERSRISLDDLLGIDRPGTFCHRVDGDGWLDEHIPHGSILIVDRTLTAKLGDLVLARLDGSDRFICRLERSQPLAECHVIIACVTKFTHARARGR